MLYGNRLAHELYLMTRTTIGLAAIMFSSVSYPSYQNLLNVFSILSLGLHDEMLCGEILQGDNILGVFTEESVMHKSSPVESTYGVEHTTSAKKVIICTHVEPKERVLLT